MASGLAESRGRQKEARFYVAQTYLTAESAETRHVSTYGTYRRIEGLPS